MESETQNNPTIHSKDDTDHLIGAFSDHGPWKVDLDRILWLPAIETLRRQSRDRIPTLLQKRRIPPTVRLLKVSFLIGRALLFWRILERPKGNPSSQIALSKRLKLAFEQLGPTYVKLGQIVSSGDGIFPEELVREFKSLRDKVKAEDFATVRSTIEAEFGTDLEDIFIEFNTTAIAAASIAQVYFARLRTGEEVVVKVQRSTVASLVTKDLAAMSWISPALIGRIPITALANPPALVELFAETIVEELDFRLEAANMLDIARLLRETDQHAIIVPRPHPKYVTRRVLVMEKLSGFSWDDPQGMQKAGINTSEVLRVALVSFMEGVMLYGIFHGDLHGGNLMVTPEGVVVLLDYGITGRLPEQKRLAFLKLLMGGTVNDVRMQTAALRDLGALPNDTDIETVIQDLGLDRPAKDPTQMTPEELTSEIRELTKALLGYGAKLPKELMLFIKNMIFLDSSIATLAPEIDLFSEITYLAGYFTTKHGARIAKDVGVDLRETTVDLDGVRGSLGLDSDVETLTYEELRQRREVIRSRMKHRSDKQQARSKLRILNR